MEHTCKYCEQPKTTEQMAVRGGKVSKQCLECKENRTGLGAGAPKKKQARRKAQQVEEMRLTMPGGGYGFDAFITEDDQLQITQENEGAKADNVCLTRHEVRQLFDKFGVWAVEA